MDVAGYCREIEAYLCRQNGGHLVRVVGPAFEMVKSWAARGVPLKVVFAGIDRRIGRQPPGALRRRPLRIEFCEPDVLDVFDEWRRAVGVAIDRTGTAPSSDSSSPGERAAPSRRSSLRAHVLRVTTRLSTLLAHAEPAPGVHAALEEAVAHLTSLDDRALRGRGESRDRLVARLAEWDDQLVEAIERRAEPTWLATIGEEAAGELAPFRPRMASPTYEQALARCQRRLLRERLGLPRLSFDP